MASLDTNSNVINVLVMQSTRRPTRRGGAATVGYRGAVLSVHRFGEDEKRAFNRKSLKALDLLSEADGTRTRNPRIDSPIL